MTCNTLRWRQVSTWSGSGLSGVSGITTGALPLGLRPGRPFGRTGASGTPAALRSSVSSMGRTSRSWSADHGWPLTDASTDTSLTFGGAIHQTPVRRVARNVRPARYRAGMPVFDRTIIRSNWRPIERAFGQGAGRRAVPGAPGLPAALPAALPGGAGAPGRDVGGAGPGCRGVPGRDAGMPGVPRRAGTPSAAARPRHAGDVPRTMAPACDFWFDGHR